MPELTVTKADDRVIIQRGNVEVEVVIHDKPPHEGWVAIRVPGRVGRTYPIWKIK